jgi:hypothetical protein
LGISRSFIDPALSRVASRLTVVKQKIPGMGTVAILSSPRLDHSGGMLRGLRRCAACQPRPIDID